MTKPVLHINQVYIINGVPCYFYSMTPDGIPKTENEYTTLPDFICLFVPCDRPNSAHPMCAAMATASHRFLTPFPTEFAKRVHEVHSAQVNKQSDSKPTNIHNPESEDAPPHNPVLGPVVGTATVRFEDTGAVVTLRDWCQKSSGTRFPEPSPPAESPDDWVMITDPDHVPRVGIDFFEMDDHGWMRQEDNHTKETVGEYAKITGGHRHRCRRKDLPVVPHHVACSADRSKPVGSSGCSCPTLNGVPVTGSSCPQHGLETGDVNVPSESTALPQFPEGADNNTVLWVQAAAWTTLYEWCRENGMPSYRELNGLQNLAQWILDLKSAANPNRPNAAPADKPRMRQVTLREYECSGGKLWGEQRYAGFESTGRTAVVEVPE